MILVLLPLMLLGLAAAVGGAVVAGADVRYRKGAPCVCSEALNLLRSSILLIVHLTQKLTLRKTK